MRSLLTLMMLAMCGCKFTVHYPPRPAPPLPRVATASELKMITPVNSFAAGTSTVAPKTVDIPWVWDAPLIMTGVDHYEFYHGTNSGTYFEQFVLGLETNYTARFVKGMAHYVLVASAKADGALIGLSNESKWPQGPHSFNPTNIIITGNAPLMEVQQSTDLKRWTVVTNTASSSVVLQIAGMAFFRTRGTNATRLTITPQ